MRIAAKLLATAVLGAAALGARASTEHLDFNDNLVPGGWTLVPTSAVGTNWGIASGRLYAGGGTVDSGVVLQRGASGLTSNATISLEWDGNLMRTLWGNFSGVRLPFAALDDLTSEYRAQIGAAQASYPLNSVVVGVANDVAVQMHDLPDGVYRYRAVFSQGMISFAGSLDGTERFSWAYTNPNIDMSQVSGIRLHVYETVGPDVWIDNVTVTVSAVPEPSSLALFLAGVLGLAGWRHHRNTRTQRRLTP